MPADPFFRTACLGRKFSYSNKTPGKKNMVCALWPRHGPILLEMDSTPSDTRLRSARLNDAVGRRIPKSDRLIISGFNQASPFKKTMVTLLKTSVNF